MPTVVTIQKLADVYEGGASGTVRFTRDDTSGMLTVYYLVTGGTATPGTDFATNAGQTSFMPGMATSDVLIGPFQDTESEPTETIVISVGSDPAYTAGGSGFATLYLYDDDTPTVSVTKITDAAEGGAGGTFRFTRLGDLSNSLVANFSVTGTAVSGTDYNPIGTTVNFAPGSATADVTVTAPGNTTIEGSRSLTLTLTTGTGYTVGGSNAADLSIIDVIYRSTFDWNGVATVGVLVTYDDPDHPGQFFWKYHVTNESLASGLTAFAVPAEDTALVHNLGSSVSWAGSVGTFLSDAPLVSWQANGAPAIGIGGVADFWFTTQPLEAAFSKGFVSDPGLTVTPGGFLLVPTAAPIPPAPPGLPIAPMPRTLLVSTGVDKYDPNNGLTSLREAIIWVNHQDQPGHQLQIKFAKEGVSTITLGQEEQLPSFENDVNVFINGTDRNILIRRDEAWGEFRLLEAGNGSTVKIAGLTLADGGGSDFNGEGGAIRALGDLTLQDCWIRDNQSGMGGGVFCAGLLDMQNCIVQNNAAVLDGGGVFAGSALKITGGAIFLNEAVHGGGVFASTGTVTVEDATIMLNKAVSTLAFGQGGGIFIGKGVTQAQITNTTIGNNNASSAGGGLYVDGAAGGAEALPNVTLRDCVINWNTASTGGGVNVVAGTLTVYTTTISSNEADFGGGVYIDGLVAAVNFYSSTIRGNTATTSGGGIWIVGSQTEAPSSVILDNTWVIGNTAANQGGGIGVRFQEGNTSSLLLKGNTLISSNLLTAQDSIGGGLYLGSGVVTFDGVTFDTNIATSATGFYAASGAGVIEGEGGATFNNDTWLIET